MDERLKAFKDNFSKDLWFRKGDLRDYNFVLECFREFKPDAIVHFGEMPSAPYSMVDVDHCTFTQANNMTL